MIHANPAHSACTYRAARQGDWPVRGVSVDLRASSTAVDDVAGRDQRRARSGQRSAGEGDVIACTAGGQREIIVRGVRIESGN